MSDTKCPIVRCTNRKEDWHLTCAAHWRKVPPAEQKRLYQLYKRDMGGVEHRKLCFAILEKLNAAAVTTR